MSSSLLRCVLVGACLVYGAAGTSRAGDATDKANNDEESDVPVGYQQAAEPAQTAPKKDEAESAQQEPVEADPPKEEAPVGYANADKADKQAKQPQRRVAVQALPVAKAANLFANNAQLQALAAQIEPRVKPFFAAELSFAKSVCEPNSEQLQKMKDLAIPELAKAVQALTMQQAPQMGLGGRWGGVQQQPTHILEQLEDAADRIVSQVFPAELAQRYRDEQDRRRDFRARAGAAALVAYLDTRFRFSPAQREAISDALQHVWQRGWQRYLQFMASNPQCFPPVPDEAILPHLNEVQTKQWKATRRTGIRFHWQNLNHQGLFQNMAPVIDWFADDPNDKADKDPGAAGLIRGALNVVAVIDAAIDEAVEAANQAAEEGRKQ